MVFGMKSQPAVNLNKGFMPLFLIMACGMKPFSALAQPELKMRELFKLPISRFIGEGPFNFKIAVDSEETIALVSCNKNIIYYIARHGTVADTLVVPFTSCIRNMEFDEHDHLLIMDNEETFIYRHNRIKKRLDKIPYHKPEDWYKQLNHYYRHFEISSIPTFYVNKEYLQDAYYTRFDYSYNLWLNYQDGYIYQSAYNFIRKIGNRKTYVALRKNDLWFSERLTNKSKLLLLDRDSEVAVYFDRVLTLYVEDFKNNSIRAYPCPSRNNEGIQLDFSTNIEQRKIWGVSAIDEQTFTLAIWQFR
jgi:hypothetical protein